MSEDRNTYADVWEQLDPKYAERVRVTDAATLGDEEIVRRWPQIGEGCLSKCMKALSLFTDSSNSKPRLWVNNPIVGREVFPGAYRLVTVDVDTQKSGLKGIIQTLRKGFNTTANWSEARLEEYEQGVSNDVSVAGVAAASDNPTRMLKVLFPNCSPDHARAIASSLASSTHSNVIVRGETYSGTWTAIWAASKIEDDGSATITLFLALAQYNLVSYSDFATERQQDVVYLYDVPKNEAQTVINSWKTVHPVGSSATANYSRSNGLVDLVLRTKTGEAIEFDFGNVGADCRYAESQIAIFGTDDETAYPIPAIVAGAGISYKRDVRSNGDGTFDVFLTMKEVKYRNATGLIIEQSAAETTTQQQQLGVTNQVIATMEEEPGKIKTQRVEIKDDCSKDATTNVSVGKEMETETKVASAGGVETTVEKTYQSAPLADPSAQDGHIKSVRNSDSKYPGKYDTLSSDKEVKPLDSVARGGGALYDEETTTNQNAVADQSGGSPGAEGEIIDRSSRKNDAGRFDNSTTKRTAKAFGPKIDVHGTPLVEETIELLKNQSAFPNPGTPADGTSVDVSGSINELAKLDYAKTTRRDIPKTVAPLKSEETESSQRTTQIKLNQSSIAETRGANEVLRVSVDVGERGLLNAKIDRETPKAVVTGPFTADADGYKQTQVTKFDNADAIPVASGKGQRVDAKKNDFGKYDAVKTVVSATEFYVDFNEPAVTGRKPSFNRIIFGINDSATIQARISAWFAIVQAQTTEIYSYSCSVSRDGDGYYQLTMSANPKAAGGGSQEWDDGFDYSVPICKKRSDYLYSYAKITYTSSKSKVKSLFDNAGADLIEEGAGGTTGVQFIGRGRYKVTLVYGTDTLPS